MELVLPLAPYDVAQTTERGLVTRQRLIERVNKFTSGVWSLLVEESSIAVVSGDVSSRRRRRRQRSGDIERRANRALSLVQMGELSAGRQALEAAVIALGAQQTLDMLRAAVPGLHFGLTICWTWIKQSSGDASIRLEEEQPRDHPA